MRTVCKAWYRAVECYVKETILSKHSAVTILHGLGFGKTGGINIERGSNITGCNHGVVGNTIVECLKCEDSFCNTCVFAFPCIYNYCQTTYTCKTCVSILPKCDHCGRPKIDCTNHPQSPCDRCDASICSHCSNNITYTTSKRTTKSYCPLCIKTMYKRLKLHP
jgi:hypothetical protein